MIRGRISVQDGHLYGNSLDFCNWRAKPGRIAKYDQSGPLINAVPVLNPNAIADAQAAAARIQAGASFKDYPLLGIPIVVKDSYDVAGLPTTNGIGIQHAAGPGSVTDLVAPQDSFAVAQLRAAGAIIIGKTNLSTLARSTTDSGSDAFGRELNPYAPLRTAGGSSSGTGAAVASSFAMFGMGGETGGSIRVPATHNDLVGLKTSAGLIDPGGTWPLTPSRDVVGPLARDVTDIAYAMNALVHPSPTNLWNHTPYYLGREDGHTEAVSGSADGVEEQRGKEEDQGHHLTRRPPVVR